MRMQFDAINVFDFDGTLTTETWPKFWVWVKKFGYNGEQRNDELEAALKQYRSTHDGNHLETFFGFFNDLLAENNETLTYDELLEGEKYIQYNPGVKEFLRETQTRNYIVSGGLCEFLERLEIAQFFDGIYGTPVRHGEDGKIIGIGEVMTDDKKIAAIRDILKKNDRENDDCRDVYYVGDGYSDGPAMKFVHDNGGKAIFVYQPDKNEGLREYNDKIYQMLKADGAVDFSCVANYQPDYALYEILQRMANI